MQNYSKYFLVFHHNLSKLVHVLFYYIYEMAKFIYTHLESQTNNNCYLIVKRFFWLNERKKTWMKPIRIKALFTTYWWVSCADRTSLVSIHLSDGKNPKWKNCIHSVTFTIKWEKEKLRKYSGAEKHFCLNFTIQRRQKHQFLWNKARQKYHRKHNIKILVSKIVETGWLTSEKT